MTERLTIFSTIDDLRNASDEVLINDIDAVGREVVLEYILELRRNVQPTQLGPPIICPAPPTLPELPLDRVCIRENTAAESQAARSKSSRNQIKFSARFKNSTRSAVDLIWKNYDGEEELVRQNLQPGDTHKQSTCLTHPFIARNSGTQKLQSFLYNTKTSAVFEGLNFGVPHNGSVTVSICEGKFEDVKPELPEPRFNEVKKDQTAEELASKSKSHNAYKSFTARFKNNTQSNIDLIWKNYNGEQVTVRQDIEPGVTHAEGTYFTHPFIARDSATQQLRSFSFNSITSVVFEGNNFGVERGGDVVTVGIC